MWFSLTPLGVESLWFSLASPLGVESLWFSLAPPWGVKPVAALPLAAALVPFPSAVATLSIPETVFSALFPPTAGLTVRLGFAAFPTPGAVPGFPDAPPPAAPPSLPDTPRKADVSEAVTAVFLDPEFPEPSGAGVFPAPIGVKPVGAGAAGDLSGTRGIGLRRVKPDPATGSVGDWRVPVEGVVRPLTLEDRTTLLAGATSNRELRPELRPERGTVSCFAELQ